ncbi:amino acid adenylation domain-containing protein [Streptomyces sp. NPDC057287]|uniref:amino acid adenylation domain-containing protein n=1 Tax=Streptomyces sp. NPDC057287 TaxID=3346086 RepID=UPI0036354A9A
MTALLPELFLDRAREHPDAPAVVAGADEVSYRELEGAARRVAGALTGLGAGRESVVAVLMTPGPDLVAALLGIWLAGGCYLPLDPYAPPARLRQTVEAAGARLAVVDETWAARGAELSPTTTAHQVDRLLEMGDPDTPPCATEVHRAAYMIFTSGSTGVPKGVVVEHEGIANRVLWGVRALELTPRDRVLQKTPLTFDAAGWEIFGPLVCGAPVTFGRADAGRDPAELLASLREQEATVVQVVPTMLRLLAAEPDLASCKSLRTVCSAGEPLHAELCRRVLAQVDVEIWNTYGPTECSIDALAHRFDPAQLTGAVPIGRPIDNARVLALPADGDSTAGDAPLELYLCGPGVARGYHQDAARTAERFVPDADGPPGSRMFRTGDLVRRRPDGALEFVGRADSQVKINGVRVEPGEVEAALETHPEVVEAVVRAVDGPEGPGGARRLAAWVVTTRPGAAERLTAYLRDRLPPALVPAVVAEIDTLPRTSSGKTDRARLPDPDWSRAPGTAAAPRTAEERIVLGAWRQMLDTDEIGLDDDFFRLGGHSLMLTRLSALLTRASGLAVTLRDLQYASTARRQAELLGRASKAQPIAQLPPGARLPLSHAQERFWVLDRMDPGNREYLLPILVWLPSEVPAQVVREALARLVERHEVLRTRYGMDAQGLAAVVEPRVPDALRTVETTPGQMADTLAEELAEGFDLSVAPMFRAALVRDGGPEQLLLLVCHHIIGDGWSSRLLEQELRETVTAIREGREPALPEAALRYVDAVAWQRDQITEAQSAEQLAYWSRQLAGLPPLELPAIRERAARRSIDGAGIVVDVPAPAAEALIALGRRTGATPYVVLLTLWTVTLARAAGQWDFGVGSPHAGRTRPELHGLVGLFLNTVVLRPELTPDLSFAEALAAVEHTCREGFARHAVPFEAVADAVAPERELSRTALFQTLFALTGDETVGQVPRERDLELLGRAWTVSRTDLALTLWPRPDGGYGGALEYSSALYDRTLAAGLAERLRRLAGQFAVDPGLPIGATHLDADDDEDGNDDVLHDIRTDETPAAPPPADGPAAFPDTVLGFVRELLTQPDVGPNDDFMARGGTSLLAARLLWNVQSVFGVEVSMRSFFDLPTAAALAREVARLQPPPDTQVPDGDPSAHRGTTERDA